MKPIRLLLLVFCLIQVHHGHAQDCKNSLYEANKLFEKGRFSECIQVLEPCLKYSKSKEEKIESYHLLAQTYQLINQLDKANLYIKKMLYLKLDYQDFPNIDPIDFSRLVNQYSVKPIFYLGIKAGMNITTANLIKSYSTYNSTQRYLNVNGYQLGFDALYQLKNNWGFRADLLASGIGIHHQIDSTGRWDQNYYEQLRFVQLILSAQKEFKLNESISLHAGVGFGASYMYKSSVYLETKNFETGSIRQATQSPVDSRNRWQNSLQGLIGVSTKAGKGTIGLEVQYGYFLKNTVNDSKRMKDLDFIFNNHYINDDIRLRSLMFNIGYKHPVIWKVRLK